MLSSDPNYVNIGIRDSQGTFNSEKTAGISIPKLTGLTNGADDSEDLVPVTADSPTFTKGFTDRSYISRISKTKVREIPMSDARISQTQADEKPYDFQKYKYDNELTDSQEMEMLAAIQGARSVDFEPTNIMSPRANHATNTKPTFVITDPGELHNGKAFQKVTGPEGHMTQRSNERSRSRASRETGTESPTMISDDDTSFSTWKPPQSHQKGSLHPAMFMDSSDTYNSREFSGVCSPPVPLRGAPGSNSLDDISSLSNPSPRKQITGESAKNTDDEEELDLLYDSQINCYYDPKTYKYYELS